MKYKTIEFARKFNIGNFETKDIKLSVEIEDEDIDKVFMELKNKVMELGEKK